MPPATKTNATARGSVSLAWCIVALGLLLLCAMLWSLTLGSRTLPIATVVEALLQPKDQPDHYVVAAVRLPRLLAALLIGAALAVAGALLQTITRNPMASPGLLGINAGAAFAVVLAIMALGTRTGQLLALVAIVGGILAGLLVYAFASLGRDGPTPLKLIMAGAILSGALASVTAAIMLADQQTFDDVRLWTVGSLANRQMNQVMATAPQILIFLVVCLSLARPLNILSLGDETAAALGLNASLWRIIAGGVAIALAAGAVSLAGPVAFVGLIVPHAVRLIAGADHRKLLPLCALGGSLLVVVADGLTRSIFRAQDIPVGVAMAVIGAPFFIYLAATSRPGR